MPDVLDVLHRSVGTVAAVAWTATCLSCAPASRETERPGDNPNRMIQLLAAGDPVFGIFSGDHTAEQGAVMAQNQDADFVFYSLESGPFDVPALRAYMQGMRDATGTDPGHPLALRIPPIREGEAAARDHIREALDAGIDAIVFPHVETAEHAAVAVSAMGPELWPGNAEGRLLGMLIVEDRLGVEHVEGIVSTPGVGVVFAGPGDLRRAYDRDMEAVENAIQAVLAACKAAGIPCGITAGVDDIAERLAQGFRVIIVTQPEALAVGREAAGRR